MFYICEIELSVQETRCQMGLTIHRGSNEIGGTCVELQFEESGIPIDCGLPMFDEGREPFDFKKTKLKTQKGLVRSAVLPPIPGLDNNNPAIISAILSSHPHHDHYGLFSYAIPEVPIFTRSRIFECGPAVWDQRLEAIE
jgi:ribonuclease J